MAKKKEIVNKETGEITEYQGETWGNEGMDNDDILIPKLRLMQPMSELVTEGIAQMGEFRDSLNTDNKLGGVGEPVEFVVFSSFKTWWVFEDDEYVETVAYGPENAHWRKEYETVVDGTTIKRSLLLNYYVLTTAEMADGMAFPKVITFKGTSGQAGKKLATFLKMLQAVKQPAATTVFNLHCKQEKNDKGVFFVMDVTKARKSTKEEMDMAKLWYTTLQTTTVKVDAEAEEVTKAPKEAPADVPNYAPQSSAQENITV